MSGVCQIYTNTTISNFDNRCGIDPVTRANYGVCNTTAYCCSAFGYCGVDDSFCIGCQADYGYCPKQCDANTAFCGPFNIASFAMATFSAFVAVLAIVAQFLRWRGII